MVDKPRLAIDIYNEYVREDNSVYWPDDKEERALLARALFGRELMSDFDYSIKYYIDFLENVEPTKPFTRKNQLHHKDTYFRSNMQTLNPKQKQAIRDLVLEIMYGSFFSPLVTLDQGYFGKFDLQLEPFDEDENSGISLFSFLPDELHDELNDWIVSFSEFANEIVELVQHPKGFWHFQPVKTY